MNKLYAISGQTETALWGRLFDGDTVLEHDFSLSRNNSLVLSWKTRRWACQVFDGDNAVDISNGTHAMTTSRGKRKRQRGTAALGFLVEILATTTASTATHTRCTEMVSLSKTLKNLRECHADPNLIKAVEKQLECLQQGMEKLRVHADDKWPQTR